MLSKTLRALLLLTDKELAATSRLAVRCKLKWSDQRGGFMSKIAELKALEAELEAQLKQLDVLKNDKALQEKSSSKISSQLLWPSTTLVCAGSFSYSTLK